jgi:tetratricopeptide (TPR) repeat protein
MIVVARSSRRPVHPATLDFARPRMHRLLAPVALVLLLPALGAGAQPPGPAPEAPADPSALLTRAVSLHRAGDVEGAVAFYERVLALGAESAGLRSNLGAAYAHLGRYDDAIEQYRRALAADGANAAIRRNLALACYKSRRIAEAAGEAEAALLAQPDSAPAALLVADCRFRLGQSVRVVEVLQPLAARGEPDRAVSYLLGMALLAEGRTAEAQAAIDRVKGVSDALSRLLGKTAAAEPTRLQP